MKLSEEKKFTNEFDYRVFALLKTLECYYDKFDYPKEIDTYLNNFIRFLNKEVYHDLPTEHDVKLLDEKYYVTTYFQEVI